MLAAIKLWITLTIIFLYSCTDRPEHFENKEQLVAYMRDEANGLNYCVSNEEGVSLCVSAFPVSALPDIGRKTKTDYNRNQYFLLSFSKGGKEILRQLSTDEYGVMLYTLSFGMENFVSLKTNDGETIDLLGVFFQPTYGMGNSNDVLIVADEREFLNSKELIIEIDEFGLRLGRRVFHFDTEDLEYTRRVLLKK